MIVQLLFTCENACVNILTNTNTLNNNLFTFSGLVLSYFAYNNLLGEPARMGVKGGLLATVGQ